jgi:sugar/nucleoside kinase (ribokinase family)
VDATPPLDVVGVGYCCLDELILLNHMPLAEGHATVLGRDEQGGGMVPTAMVAAAKLGGGAGMVARVGDDPIGDAILAELRAYGVDTSRAVRQPGATSHKTVVLVDSRTGGRTFLSQPGTVQPLQAGDLERAYVVSGRVIHVSEGGPAALQAARWAKEAGRDVCLDGTLFRPGIAAIAPLVDYMIVGQYFAREILAYKDAGVAITPAMAAEDVLQAGGPPSIRLPAPAAGHVPPETHGAAQQIDRATAEGEHHPVGERSLEVAEALRALGSRVAVVTDGERGCWCASADGTFHLPAYPVAAVDTTGAGDVFHGAFLAAIARGWDLRRSLLVASAAAALKCRKLGGRAGIPTLNETLALVDG